MHFLCNSHSSISTNQTQPFKPKRFSFSLLQSSTNNFSQTTLLGKGSHGAVYLATVLGNQPNTRKRYAVKLSTSSLTEPSQNELKILSHIHSPRIVNLIGYAINPNLSPPKLLLVVEYMPNGSLYDLLHKKPNPPGLSTRVRFLLQISKAVRTLHGSDPPVMHRDIKSSNVLIDEKGNARLSDFGLAIEGHVSDMREVSTPPAGTLGYLDPCYIAPGDLSTKIDVFSFGIFLFEVLSGRKAIDVEFSPSYILEWALPLVKSGGFRGVIDRRISGWDGVHRTVVMELCLLGDRCVRSTAEKRPSVGEIVECLKRVYRRVKLKGFDCWSHLRRRVGRVESSWPLDAGCDDDDVEEELTRGGDQGMRTRSKSKSIGSFREIAKVGPDVLVNDDLMKVKRKGQVTVKISGVKLSKSKSMSGLYRGKNSKVEDLEVNEDVEVFPLLVNFNGIEKLEEQVQQQ